MFIFLALNNEFIVHCMLLIMEDTITSYQFYSEVPIFVDMGIRM